ncbi:phosphatase PAP2 family protein [Gordonia sp. NB41Y]|uniref:phosphatase PAP2 family protein n=1 Tax=Gordonia sp. NB41Y TaxID=875808 RepID=UPI0002BF2EB7|nr:phosphatase PAP2 family protein [Gordonia sp. NB41Y]EMP11090.1 phosphoesterase [Gordonia sp. NB41Y]WLP92916.1 phosphatase PAP2 family protein [Gordonia sp. NB41Y]
MSVLATAPQNGGVDPYRGRSAGGGAGRGTPGVGGSIALAVIALVLAGGVYAVAIWTSFGQLVDQYVLDAVRSSSAVAHVPHLLTVDAVTDPKVWLVAAALAIAGSLIPGITGQSRIGPTLGRTAVLLAFPPVVILVVRFLRDVVLPRPQLHDWIVETSNSAPSGHTAAVMSCVVVLIAAAPKWLRPVVIALGGTWASVIAFGLIADGWHRPSDVVMSVLIVIGLGALLPDPHAATAAPRGIGVFSVLAVVASVVATPLLVGQSYADTRQVVTAAGIAVVVGLALLVYRPCAYGARRSVGRTSGRGR